MYANTFIKTQLHIIGDIDTIAVVFDIADMFFSLLKPFLF
jgi:hypothetical protein